MKHLLILCAFLSVWAFPSKILAQGSLAPVVAEVAPSVVLVRAERINDSDAANVINSLLFAQPDGKTVMGAGFVFDAKGYVATNAHVVYKASQISVETNEGQIFETEIIGTDALSDVAVLKLRATPKLKSITWGDSDKVLTGEQILTAGNPFGLGLSFSAGIVSATNRVYAENPLDNYLQTDAYIVPGYSGGPIFNAKGEVIGMNTAIYSTTGSAQGVAMALSANDARQILENLKKNGQINRRWLGLELAPTKTSDNVSGLVIKALLDETLAAQNNLQAADIILEINGQKALSAKAFGRMVAHLPAEQKISLKIKRGNQILDLKVQTAPMPNLEPKTAEVDKMAEGAVVLMQNYPEIGLSLQGLTVTRLDENGEAFQKGVRVGDVLEQINNTSLTQPEEVAYYLDEAKAKREPLAVTFRSKESAETYFATLYLKEERHAD